MLVGLDDHFQHIARISASLIHQSVTDSQECGECRLGDTVQLPPLVVGLLEPIHATEREQALDTCKHRLDIVGGEQLQGDVHVARPFLGKVVVEDLSDQRHELLSYWRGRGSEGGYESFAERDLLIFRDGRVLGEVFVEFP